MRFVDPASRLYRFFGSAYDNQRSMSLGQHAWPLAGSESLANGMYWSSLTASSTDVCFGYSLSLGEKGDAR